MALTIKECTKDISTYATAVKSDHHTKNSPIQAPEIATLQQALKTAREEEATEEINRKRRLCNLIIHGVTENSTDVNKWAADFINDIHVHISIKSVSRIGNEQNGKVRPLLIKLNSKNDKAKIFGNLSALKGLDKYKGVHVMEDLTVDQRNIIKELSNKAKGRNSQENPTTYSWRVRGSSKNGFFLTKVNKTPNVNQQQ